MGKLVIVQAVGDFAAAAMIASASRRGAHRDPCSPARRPLSAGPAHESGRALQAAEGDREVLDRALGLGPATKPLPAPGFAHGVVFDSVFALDQDRRCLRVPFLDCGKLLTTEVGYGQTDPR